VCDAETDPLPPDKPARDARVLTVPSGQTAKLGKGGTLASRQAIIHSLAHIESWAVDLSWVRSTIHEGEGCCLADGAGVATKV
jgi:uncharacterized ferritin-like protein (DUF455 family)